MKQIEWNEDMRKKEAIVRKYEDWCWISIQKYFISELVIDGCNEMKNDLLIEGFDYLKSIVVRKCTMQNLSGLKICNCELLERIETENCDSFEKGSFKKVDIVEISSLFDLIHLI